MKSLIRVLIAIFALVSIARAADEKEACTCTAGGACICPAGTCACKAAGAVEKKNCGCACCKGKDVCCCNESGDDVEKPAGHALKGVVIDVLADKKSLLVKHEEIPGVMKAMTMLFRVDDDTLASAKKGEAITARMTNEDGAWWLHDVKASAK